MERKRLSPEVVINKKLQYAKELEMQVIIIYEPPALSQLTCKLAN